MGINQSYDNFTCFRELFAPSWCFQTIDLLMHTLHFEQIEQFVGKLGCKYSTSTICIIYNRPFVSHTHTQPRYEQTYPAVTRLFVSNILKICVFVCWLIKTTSIHVFFGGFSIQGHTLHPNHPKRTLKLAVKVSLPAAWIYWKLYIYPTHVPWQVGKAEVAFPETTQKGHKTYLFLRVFYGK